jgi:hypothetical protein
MKRTSETPRWNLGEARRQQMHVRQIAVVAVMAASLFPVFPWACGAQASLPASVDADRWLEIDMYWFNQQNPAKSAQEFWERFQPLYAGVTGYRGIILNIGWTVGPVMEWSGNLDQRITLPTGSGQAKWVDESGPLTGTTEERKKKSEARFAGAVVASRHGYDPWTWGNVKSLVADLKAEAARRGISGLKVGILNYASTEAYGEVAPWFGRHPESVTKSDKVEAYFDPSALLHADAAPLGGFPKGIPEGTPVHQAYAAQWGSLSRAVGLDAVMLRDSFGMPYAYRRLGPWGPLAPSPEVIHKATDAVAALVKETKLANPGALVMMYSNAASAIGDWRCNGFDLEAIAKQGYLDIWVDQTWAGAWNEVGIREGSFWNNPTLGWTYELAYMLTHAAILADTKVRHYPLVETFDAWESWDVIHSAPEKLRWGIWAYSHAAVKTPHGLKLPAGTYISWANQGQRLLSEKDVSYLAGNINAAVTDARQMTEVYGPTLVYSREAMQWQAEHATPEHDVNEWMDEAMGSVMKWPVPVLSSTKLEWLPQVTSDLFVVGTPSHLPAKQLASLEATIKKGQPVALVGSFAGGIDPSLLSGVATIEHTAQGPNQLCNAAIDLQRDFLPSVPKEFSIYCRPEGDIEMEISDTAVVYRQRGAPALTIAGSYGWRVALWNPPDLRQLEGISLKEIWGNTGAPYALAAGTLTELLRQNASLHTSGIELGQTVSVAAWLTKDSGMRILAGNLEEGLRDDADFSRQTTLVLPQAWQAKTWKDAWGGRGVSTRQGSLHLSLQQASSVLLESSR